MKKFKLSALLLSVAMVFTMFTGCGSTSETLVTIDGKEIKSYMFEYFVRSQAQSFESQGMDMVDFLSQDMGDGTTYEESLMDYIIETMKMYVACEKLADENGLALTDEEIQQIADTKDQQIEEMGGRKEFAAQLEAAQIQEEAIDELNRYGTIQSKVYTGLFGQGGKFAPSTDAIIAKVLPGNVRVKHVLIQATAGSEDYETKKATAQQVQQRAAAGEDFEALIEEFNEDPGMDSNPEGYIFDENGTNFDGSGTMDSAFAAGSVALAVNGVSPIIETSYGFHIIKRYPLDEAYISENLATFSDAAAYDVFEEKIAEACEGMSVVKTDAYEKFSAIELLGGPHDHDTGSTTGTLTDDTAADDTAADDTAADDTAADDAAAGTDAEAAE